MLQAGVIVPDYTMLMVEILKDNARAEAGEVYAAMTWVGPNLPARSPRLTKGKRTAKRP